MSNVSIFRNHIKELELRMLEEAEESGEVFFTINYLLQNGSEILFEVMFFEEQHVVDLRVRNFAGVASPSKRPTLHQLLNHLNTYCRYVKLTETDGEVTAVYTMPYSEKGIDPDSILDMISLMMQTIEGIIHEFDELQRV